MGHQAVQKYRIWSYSTITMWVLWSCQPGNCTATLWWLQYQQSKQIERWVSRRLGSFWCPRKWHPFPNKIAGLGRWDHSAIRTGGPSETAKARTRRNQNSRNWLVGETLPPKQIIVCLGCSRKQIEDCQRELSKKRPRRSCWRRIRRSFCFLVSNTKKEQ